MPSVDKALISHELPPISIDEAFKHIKDARLLWKVVNVLGFLVGLIAGILFALAWVR